ncbi:immunity 51 family protein [Streptomyces yaizuensis]|uniref:Immunity 51 family protein n=1 Tax=Streptomyces yaizuensis TaxID=2989713 RepID=A0ABQ5P9B2_9ACTN|nr:immunity 51 family protein [Streptomyces sp. YSPA8]GLF99168.1 immunity 51 family protein [Streptomyces sp. YSPA8]
MTNTTGAADAGHGDLTPLRFFEYDHRPGHYCLMLTDDHMMAAEETFAELGYEAGGYGWAGVARSALRARLGPEAAGAVGMDPEAGMFVAYGDDPAALRALGAVLREALRDRAVLRELIEAGEPDWFD